MAPGIAVSTLIADGEDSDVLLAESQGATSSWLGTAVLVTSPPC